LKIPQLIVPPVLGTGSESTTQVVGEARDPLPCHAALLTAAPERALPEFGDEEAKGGVGTAW